MSGKDDKDRSNNKEYKSNYEKIDRSKPVSTKGFKMKINGEVVR